MNTTELSEKQLIELATAEGFLALYNKLRGTSYSVKKVAGDGETPDILTKDDHDRPLGIEVTLTEDRPGDIASTLGRSNHNSGDAIRAHLQRVKEGKEQIEFNCLSQNVFAILVERIKAKVNKRYGSNIALVIRDTSGVPWEWKQVVPLVQENLNVKHIPFDHGIWLLSRCKTVLTPIYPEAFSMNGTLHAPSAAR
jgi:hypothetical protein